MENSILITIMKIHQIVMIYVYLFKKIKPYFNEFWGLVIYAHFLICNHQHITALLTINS